jgi:mannose-6-phosphate isomerase-like protein (cupin superfamily)
MVIDERTIEEKPLPGRYMRWLLTPETSGKRRFFSNVSQPRHARTAVKPAHASSRKGDELVYIVHGSGRVMIDGEISPVREGCLIHFPQGSIHILQNTGDTELKAACFFSPAANLSTYKFYEDVELPD